MEKEEFPQKKRKEPTPEKEVAQEKILTAEEAFNIWENLNTNLERSS